MNPSVDKRRKTRILKSGEPLPSPPEAAVLKTPRKPRRWLWFALTASFFFLVFLFFGPLDWILSGWMIYETPQQNVDVTLVGGIGGNLETAARLYKEGKTNSILITNAAPEKYQGVNAPLSLYYFIRKQILDQGVPEEAIDSLPKPARTMLERQLMLQKWIRDHGVHSYLSFSGRYSSRLTKMMHDDTFPEGDVRLVIYPSEGKGIWRKEMMNIHNTLIRMAYWRLVYQQQMREHNSQNQISPALTPSTSQSQ